MLVDVLPGPDEQLEERKRAAELDVQTGGAHPLGERLADLLLRGRVRRRAQEPVGGSEEAGLLRLPLVGVQQRAAPVRTVGGEHLVRECGGPRRRGGGTRRAEALQHAAPERSVLPLELLLRNGAEQPDGPRRVGLQCCVGCVLDRRLRRRCSSPRQLEIRAWHTRSRRARRPVHAAHGPSCRAHTGLRIPSATLSGSRDSAGVDCRRQLHRVRIDWKALRTIPFSSGGPAA